MLIFARDADMLFVTAYTFRLDRMATVALVIRNLNGMVDQLRADGFIIAGIANAFKQRLAKVSKKLSHGNASTAISLDRNFIADGQTQVDSGKLDLAIDRVPNDAANELLATTTGL